MGLLPILVIVIGLIAGLVAPRLFGHIGAVSAEPTLTAQQEDLLSEFRSCLSSLPKQVTSTVVSPCAEKNATLLRGIPRATFASRLGHPDWCKSAQQSLLPWSKQSCASSSVWGYSFYRLVAVGGGP